METLIIVQVTHMIVSPLFIIGEIHRIYSSYHKILKTMLFKNAKDLNNNTVPTDYDFEVQEMSILGISSIAHNVI